MNSEDWRLGRRPGLDGLRGVAILLVVAAHLGVRSLEFLGGIGVTVFFTLSGFLITALLLDEHDLAGRISMRRFYKRRFFRLAPAFLLMLAIVVPLEFAVSGSAPYWWTTIAEVSNWVSATKGPAPLDLLHHTWSLAIEEQFYLAWPVVLWGLSQRFGRRAVIASGAVGIGLSLTTALAAHGYRLAFGTDTNASSLLAGCLLAAMMVGRNVRVAPGWTMAVSLGLALISWRFVEQPILRRFSHRVEVRVRPGVSELGGVERSPRHVDGTRLQDVSRA
ncbi:MAG: acyltransferase [Nocardioidaceae bacterium]|nr:acyltransferase [Nocardioidaceae bacterium]